MKVAWEAWLFSSWFYTRKWLKSPTELKNFPLRQLQRRRRKWSKIGERWHGHNILSSYHILHVGLHYRTVAPEVKQASDRYRAPVSEPAETNVSRVEFHAACVVWSITPQLPASPCKLEHWLLNRPPFPRLVCLVAVWSSLLLLPIKSTINIWSFLFLAFFLRFVLPDEGYVFVLFHWGWDGEGVGWGGEGVVFLKAQVCWQNKGMCGIYVCIYSSQQQEKEIHVHRTCSQHSLEIRRGRRKRWLPCAVVKLANCAQLATMWRDSVNWQQTVHS